MILRKFDTMIQKGFAIKHEVAPKALSLNGERQPMWVVLPHLVERDGLEICPQRRRLVGLAQLALTVGRCKYRDMKLIAAEKLEEQLSGSRQARRRHADFLLRFPNR